MPDQPTDAAAPAAVDAVPWYRSPVMVGAAVATISSLAALSPKAAAILGIIGTTGVQNIVESVFGLVAAGAGLFAAVHRAKSPIAPVTLTAAGAAAKSAPPVSPAVQQQITQLESAIASATAAPPPTGEQKP